MERDEPTKGPIEQFVVDDTDPLLDTAATRRDLRNLAGRIDSQFVQLSSDLRDKINSMGFTLAGLFIASNLAMFAIFLSLR